MTRVLLLEDSSNLSSIVVAALSEKGLDVDLAQTVAEAQALYEVDKYDIMLCDFELPDGTGLDFLAGIRAVDKATTILWSGLNRQRDIDASGLHVDAFFTKEKLVEVMNYINALD